MAEQDAPPQQFGYTKPTGNPSDANLSGSSGYGTLILDGQGRICGCGGGAVDALFGATESRLIGRQIQELIAGVFPEENSPGGDVRHLHHFCADNECEWHQLETVDSHGQAFAVEIHLRRRMALGQEVFVLNIRRSGETP